MPLILQLILSIAIIHYSESTLISSIPLFILLFQWINQRKLVFLLGFVFLVIFSVNQLIYFNQPDFSSKFLVIRQKNNYTVFRQGLNHYTGFIETELEPGQIVILKGTFEGNQENVISQAQSLNHHFSSLKIKEVEVIHKSKLFGFFVTESNLINKLFFNQNVEIQSDFLNLLISNGLITSLIFVEMRNWLKLFFTEKNTNLFLICLIIFFVLIIGIRFVLIRILINYILRLTKIRNPRRTLLEILIVLFLYPDASSQLAFLLPYSIRLGHFINHNSDYREIKQIVLISLVQLMSVYRVNLLQTILFQVFRKSMIIILYITLIDLFLPFLNLNFVLEIYDQLFLLFESLDLSLVGKLPLPFGLFILYSLIVHEKGMEFIYVVTISFVFYLLIYNFNPTAQIIYLNVGQGDSTLLISPYGQETILIDTGKSSEWENLKKSLNQYGVMKLDALIVTHMDEDHSGNLDNLTKTYQLNRVISHKKDSLEFVYFKAQSFLKDKYYDNENDNSLVFSIQLNNKSFLFLGDISKSVERELIKETGELTAHVMKLAHHGSRTSTDEVVFNQFNPNFAVISSDPTSYGHPHFEVLELLRKTETKTFMTSRDHHIQFIFLNDLEFIITKHQILRTK